jgi:CRP-like cAMP-binding protein
VSENEHGWSTEEVIALLHKVDLSEGLPHEDLESIASIIGGLTIEAGELLFEEGDPGHDFYVVFNGAVEISKARPDGTAERLAARRKGDGFGEMACSTTLRAPRVSGRSSKRSWSA